MLSITEWVYFSHKKDLIQACKLKMLIDYTYAVFSKLCVVPDVPGSVTSAGLAANATFPANIQRKNNVVESCIGRWPGMSIA